MSEWIKVNKELPRNGEKVFVALSNGDTYAGRYYGAFAANVTHWMPQPELPKHESSFEAWVGPLQYSLSAQAFAKEVWDAAIAASKSLDFVP